MPRIAKRDEVRRFAAGRGWTRIGEREWRELREALPDAAESTLREAGLEIDAPWSGVRQHTIEDLERSLDAFTAVYEARADLRALCRARVIEAKDHARLASRSRRVAAEKRALKTEMVEWMLIWLGDPALFPEWAALRKEKLARDKIGSCSSTSPTP